MEKHSNNKLIQNLELKNINFKIGEKSKFNNYSYYQIINAYKSLFVENVETIEDIYINVKNNINVDEYKKLFGIKADNEVFREICKKICKKYGLDYNANMKDSLLKKEISKIDYVHHIYPENTQYGDFVRMYKFEHELRLLLLKYTLIIEESVKNVFIKYLNNNSDTKANFLSDINNYNTSKGNNDALDTLKLILEKQKNKHSKPILRKRQQDLTIPYWILINELSMNETYNVIKNLKYDNSIMIFQDCVNHFTKQKLDINDKTKTKEQIKKEKGLIISFRTLIKYVGLFRNMLAHNQPIFCYNHSDYSLINYPNLNYDVPWIKKDPNVSTPKINQQRKINSVTMHDLSSFFGRDKYNAKNSDRDINLSFIIYVIYKIISTIDKNTNFYNELVELFIKYNIVLTKKKNDISDLDKVILLIDEIEKLNNLEINYDDIVSKIENKISYKQQLKSTISSFNKSRKKINALVRRIKVFNIESKYMEFPFNKRYTDYTGIDSEYFTEIK